jgi:uncharacterized membrane protein YidH (DUF202 family)
MNGKSKIFVVAVILCFIGIGLILYGNTLPQDIETFSRYSQNYLGNTNIAWLIGAVMVTASIPCFLYWLLTPSKKTKGRSWFNIARYRT